MAPARSYQDEKMDRNACDAVLIDSLRTDTGTNRNTRADTFGNTCRHARADSGPYAGTHGRTCPGAGQHELWCRAL